MANLKVTLQALLPQHHLSRLIGRLAKLEKPAWLKNALIRLFQAQYGISLAEAEYSDARDYPTFNAFFTRALKEGARPLGNSRYLQPADGVLSQRGEISDGLIIQAKGRWYSPAELLAGDAEEAKQFDRGSFATVYLSPKDYHRIHLPIAGKLRLTRYVPGELFAVNPDTTAGVDRLFARNERLVCLFDTEDGPLAVTLVGAIIVAGIATVWGGVESPQPRSIRERQWSAEDAPAFEAGEEIGRFFLGSTVVLLSTRNDLQWHQEAGASVKVCANLAD